MGYVTKQAGTRFSIVKRSKGQSAVEKSSYISRSVLVSEFDEQTYRPKYHEDLVHSEITHPPNAPKEHADRATLWNAASLAGKRQDAQLAWMLKASLLGGWSYELAEEVVKDYVQRKQQGKTVYRYQRQGSGQDRTGMIAKIKNVIPHIQDSDMVELAGQVAGKLEAMSDEEFTQVTLVATE